jgi:hypothetical protein
MKTSMLIAASGLALSVAGCGPAGPRPTLTRLDCPATQGELTRLSAADDGKSCVYRTREGEDVNLQLLPVQGDARATLQKLAASLKADALGPAGAEEAKVEMSTTAADAARVEAEAKADAGGDASDRDLGAHIRSSDEDDAGIEVSKHEGAGGDATRVDLPGVHITTENDNAQVRIGSLAIDAADGQATINVSRDVRLRGEALSREKRGIRATYLYAGKNLPGGYRFVGYEAAGPKAGPLVVATIKSKTAMPHDHDGEKTYPDVQKLVRHNGGA